MHRRTLLLGAGAARATAFTHVAMGAEAGALSAEIEFQGRVFRYHESNGKDLGDYHDPQGQFIQTCVMATAPDLPMTVMFRRDRGSDRAEVVFELGRVWSGPPATLGAYRARIYRGENEVASVDIAEHFWFSRWRWQSVRRPVRVTVASLIQQWLLPPYDAAAARGARPTQPHSYEPMSLAGVVSYMGTTGDREDIGPLTEFQAEYICTGRSAALSTAMAQAEAAGTVPWNIRDERTGAPVDVVALPKASVYAPNVGDPFIPTAKASATPDIAHQPALAYVPFLLTGDPYHLESLQFQAAYTELFLPWNMRFYVGMVRSVAWSHRTLMQAARVSPPNPPKWLLPQQTWRKQLEPHRNYIMENFVGRPEPIRSVFRTTQQEFGYIMRPWMEDFYVFNIAWGIRMGFEDWLPIFHWKIADQIARTDGESGWVRAYCSPFGLWVRADDRAPFARSWAEAWTINQAGQKWAVTDPNRWQPNQLLLTPYTRGALVMARHLGVKEADPCFRWIDEQVAAAAAARRPSPFKWAVV